MREVMLSARHASLHGKREMLLTLKLDVVLVLGGQPKCGACAIYGESDYSPTDAPHKYMKDWAD
jgi:hypothetical protein